MDGPPVTRFTNHHKWRRYCRAPHRPPLLESVGKWRFSANLARVAVVCLRQPACIVGFASDRDDSTSFSFSHILFIHSLYFS